MQLSLELKVYLILLHSLNSSIFRSRPLTTLTTHIPISSKTHKLRRNGAQKIIFGR